MNALQSIKVSFQQLVCEFLQIHLFSCNVKIRKFVSGFCRFCVCFLLSRGGDFSSEKPSLICYGEILTQWCCKQAMSNN